MACSESVAKSDEDLSLENCEREPVHIPARVQSFAVILATDPDIVKLTWCSENAEALFRMPAAQILRTSLVDLLGSQVVHDIRDALSLSSSHTHRELAASFAINETQFEAWVHFSENLPVIELEAISVPSAAEARSTLTVRSLLGRLQGVDQLDRCLNLAVLGLRGLTGFDRVLAYKFDKYGHGEVVAEARDERSEAFLGLRFPKWDIPSQAREIMKRLPLRVIADVKARDVPLISAEPDAPPLDLSLATSRGTSPIHVEYLTNMGVGGSMTLSIVVEGELWGLFAFHHPQAHHLSADLRGAAELFVQFFCLQMQQRVERARNAARQAAMMHQTALLRATDTALKLSDLIKDMAAPYCKLVGAEGLTLIDKDESFSWGVVPDLQGAMAIPEALEWVDSSRIAMTESLISHGIDGGECCGAMVLDIDRADGRYLVFFRKQAAISVQWAGAPTKSIVVENETPRLAPRGSFKAYSETVEHASLPWDTDDIVAAQQIIEALMQADSTLNRRLQHKEERQRSIYIAELNHRVRNILSLIRSLSRRTQESSHSLESYARALEQRIEALGAAHNLATNKFSSGVSIRTMLETEMKPYMTTDRGQLHIKGKDYEIRSDLAPIFALVVHELVTNCVKYGSLSVSSGTVSVAVANKDDGISIEWLERGGPAVVPSSQRGFGQSLIETAIPYEFDGHSQVSFEEQGLRVNFWLPDEVLSDIETKSDDYKIWIDDKDSSSIGAPKSVLVLEDNMMVAMDMTDMLSRLGVENVSTYPTIGHVKRFLETNKPDFAILDINLRNEESFPVAYILNEMNVDFVFASGYGSEYEMPGSLKDKVILTKPVSIELLSSTINEIYSERATCIAS